MLSAWTTPEAQAWLADSRETLRAWKAAQLDLLATWPSLPEARRISSASGPISTRTSLRERGIKLRDTTSFGLAGHWRVSVQPPEA